MPLRATRRLVVDLHSHSGASGGVGQVSLETVAGTMALKGIDVFGTGDCLHRGWRERLASSLDPAEKGLFRLANAPEPLSNARFALQTEIILTAPVPSGGRKLVHLVMLFPSFAAADAAHDLLAGWEVKLGIGRPILKCADAGEVAARLHRIAAVDESVELIPAHVLTPQGIYGSSNPVDSMATFFGEAVSLFHAVETGLSADPQVLALIPELDELALVSASDCHSGALNRVGREFTALEADSMSFEGIIRAIRERKVLYTAEFPPSEGRYFLTGHRAGRQGHENGAHCYFSPDREPADGRCPVCHKPLTVGVLHRALHLARAQGRPATPDSARPLQSSFHLVPLVEIIAASIGVKGAGSKRVRAHFDAVLAVMGTETALWDRTEEGIEQELRDAVPTEVLEGILAVRREDFGFLPPGHDGSYGRLVLGETVPWLGHRAVVS